MSGLPGKVTIDLQAAQSPGYRERGIARYAFDFTEAVVSARPDAVDRVLLDPALPEPARIGRLAGKVELANRPEWRGEGPELFHALSAFELDVPLGRLWPREVNRLGVRLVVTLYDLIPGLFPEVYLADPGMRRRYRARQGMLRAADHIVTLSESTARDAAEHLGIPDSRLTVVGASPSADFVRAGDRAACLAQARSALAGLEGPFVVYNGAIEPRKNVELLLEAYAGLPEAVRSRWQLMIVCRLKPSERNHLEVGSRQLGIEGRLVLTGFVPDDLLTLVYQATDLAVFPSLYEGYGLPVAEARACGAPVIASDVSSLPELVAPSATFDPRDPCAIAAAIEKALTDPRHRAELEEWSSRPLQTWDDVADRTLDVYDRVLSAPVTHLRAWRSRPRIAVVTPWPPVRSGVADYSARLVAAMAAHFDVDVFIDGDRNFVEPDGVPGCEAVRLHRGVDRLPDVDHAVGGFDSVLLCLGNSQFHAGALRILRNGAIRVHVLAHDVRLGDLFRHGAARGAVPEGLETVARAAYPDLPEGIGQQELDLALQRDLHMMKEIVARTETVLTTSQFAAEMARADCGEELASRVAVWPFAYPGAEERQPGEREQGLVCSFGLIHDMKAPDVLVAAVALLAGSVPDIRLALVGPVSDDLRDRLTRQAEGLGIADRLTVTGDTPDAEYRSWLARADVAVQLRRRSNGEASAAVADSLCRGVPVVVTDLGPQAELPDFVTKVPVDVTAEGLARAVGALLNDEDRKSDVARRSLAFVASHGFGTAAEQLWDLLPELAGPWPHAS